MKPKKIDTIFTRHRYYSVLIGTTEGHAKNFSLAPLSQDRLRMTPLYDVLTLQPSYDNKHIPRKELKMAMQVGRSNQYKVENIIGRHFLDTGLQSGLSRNTIHVVIDDLSANADAALVKMTDALPTKFQLEIVDSISKAISLRLPKLMLKYNSGAHFS